MSDDGSDDNNIIQFTLRTDETEQDDDEILDPDIEVQFRLKAINIQLFRLIDGLEKATGEITSTIEKTSHQKSLQLIGLVLAAVFLGYLMGVS